MAKLDMVHACAASDPPASVTDWPTYLTLRNPGLIQYSSTKGLRELPSPNYPSMGENTGVQEDSISFS